MWRGGAPSWASSCPAESVALCRNALRVQLVPLQQDSCGVGRLNAGCDQWPCTASPLCGLADRLQNAWSFHRQAGARTFTPPTFEQSQTGTQSERERAALSTQSPMLAVSMQGSFLVRPSLSLTGCLVISAVVGGSVKHMALDQQQLCTRSLDVSPVSTPALYSP